MAQARFTGQTYGEAAQQEAAQRMVPTGPPPTEPGGGVEIVPLNAPTQRPNEPVTAGATGPMPSMGIQPGSRMDLAFQVRAIASRYPNPALLALLQELEGQ